LDKFTGLDLKTQAEVSRRNEQHVAASRQNYLMKGAVAIG
jgi:hypothetical protein